MPGLIYHCGATRYREPVVDTFCGLSLWRTLTNIKNMALGFARTRICPDRGKCKYAFHPPSTCPRHFLQGESSYSCSSRMFFFTMGNYHFSALPPTVGWCFIVLLLTAGWRMMLDYQVFKRRSETNNTVLGDWEHSRYPRSCRRANKVFLHHDFKELSLTGPWESPQRPPSCLLPNAGLLAPATLSCGLHLRPFHL